MSILWSGFSAERSAAAPLRLLRLAMVATSLDEDDSTSPAEHQGETSAGSRLGSWRPARRNSCLEVQRAFRFLLTSSAPKAFPLAFRFPCKDPHSK